jgi:hypothetical protein
MYLVGLIGAIKLSPLPSSNDNDSGSSGPVIRIHYV